jgi:hypothetical protein
MLNAQHARISREICVSLFLSHWSLFIHLGADQHESKNINALFWVLGSLEKKSNPIMGTHLTWIFGA